MNCSVLVAHDRAGHTPNVRHKRQLTRTTLRLGYSALVFKALLRMWRRRRAPAYLLKGEISAADITPAKAPRNDSRQARLRAAYEKEFPYEEPDRRPIERTSRRGPTVSGGL